ncbi:MAG: GtrA family protein [Atopobiaceae bacterium]
MNQDYSESSTTTESSDSESGCGQKMPASENEAHGFAGLLLRLNERFGQVFKFGIVGVSNTIISYVVYAVLVFFGMHYLVANVIAYFAGVVNSFIWNSKFVFKAEDDPNRNPAKVFVKTLAASAFTGLVINNLLLILWVNVLNLSEYIGPILNLAVTFPLNYVLNKYWAYKKEEK